MFDLSIKFQVMTLNKRCEEAIDRFKANKRLCDPEKKVELMNFDPLVQYGIFSSEPTLDVDKLRGFLKTGDHSDVEIFIDGHGPVAHVHKIILSMWSMPFAKV